jgi:hypothetical protein
MIDSPSIPHDISYAGGKTRIASKKKARQVIALPDFSVCSIPLSIE